MFRIGSLCLILILFLTSCTTRRVSTPTKSPRKPNAITKVSFSPTGHRIVTISEDGTANLWNAESGNFLGTLSGTPGKSSTPSSEDSSSTHTPKEISSEKTTLVFGRGGDSQTMDPSKATDGETFYATKQIYNTLVQFKYGTTEIEPGLAERWEITPDGLEYTFYLRKNVKFHQTRYFSEESFFTAKDVLFSLKRQYDPTHPYHKVGDSKESFEYWLAMEMSAIVKDIVKINDHTVKFILHQPEAPFIANLAMDFAGILSKSYADKLLSQGTPEKLSQEPIGTGPFIFSQWLKDDRIIFDANSDYWGGVPHIQKLILKVIPNNSTRAAELKTGQIHIMDFPNPEEIEELSKHPKLKIIRQEGLNVGYLAMNTEMKPFDNVLVRKAVYLAINKKAIVDAIYAGLGSPAKNPIPPTIWSYHHEIEDYPYDPELAKKTLAEAGYPNGFETDFWAMPIPRPYMPNGRKVFEAIQADLSKIGIQLQFNSPDWGTYLEETKYGKHSMALLGWTGDNGDPDNFLNVLLSTKAAEKPAQNIAFFRNEAFDELIRKAKITTNVQERTQLYRKAQEIFHQEIPWVPIAHSVVVAPMREDVEGFQLEPTGSRRFDKVYFRK